MISSTSAKESRNLREDSHQSLLNLSMTVTLSSASSSCLTHSKASSTDLSFKMNSNSNMSISLNCSNRTLKRPNKSSKKEKFLLNVLMNDLQSAQICPQLLVLLTGPVVFLRESVTQCSVYQPSQQLFRSVRSIKMFKNFSIPFAKT